MGLLLCVARNDAKPATFSQLIIKSPVSGLSYKINAANTTCNTKNIIYSIQFHNCNFLYIGESGRTLRERLNGHRYDVNHKDETKVVSFHCVQHNHNDSEMNVSILKQLSGEDKERKIEELKFISQLITDCPHGSNMQHVFQRSPIFEPKAPMVCYDQ